MKVTNYTMCFLVNDTEITDVNDIANGFNDFFVNIGPELADRISNTENVNIFEYVKERNTNSMFLPEVNRNELLKVITSFESKISTDSDDFNMYTIKKIANEIIDPFLYICNLSFSKGVFPESMKIAKVVPIHKSGDKNVFTNYRPVSLLSQFSKILEKIFNNRLDSFLEKNCIINDSQYGFRNSRSTAMAIMDLLENITDGLDNKKYVMGIFIDLKKAFDTIDHGILLDKLYHYGIRGPSHDWIKSYL